MTTFPDYERHDATALAELVRKKQISPAELLDAAIERVERMNPALNAVVNRLYDQARAAVAGGLPDGPFAGVPYLMKDLGAQMAGVVTSYGSALFRDNVAPRDSELVVRLRRAGLVLFGKTNTSEFGFSTSTEPRLFGPTRNPWNPERSPGGSSGGSAAAVASGMVPMAHASDGGGSIRIPASACGLFGLKPTRGRITMGPDRGEAWSGLGVEHAVTRSVRDSAALLDATAGPGLGDPYAAPPPPERSFLAEVGAPPGRLRVAFTASAWGGLPVHPECAAAVAATAKLCADLGHQVEEARPEWDEMARGQAARVLACANVAAQVEARAAELGRPAAPDDVEALVWLAVQFGREQRACDYASALRVIHAVGRTMGEFFAFHDVLLTPTMCQPPPRLGVLSMARADNAEFVPALLQSIAFTSPFNASGLPAMSVPLHATADSLPIGVQFAAGFGAEATLFRLAAQLEAARPWADRRPPAR
jgi:amidase